jgi:uncharacterized protein (TIGR02996 family)
MPSDGESLFRAICEQPWENTPRLVYADWLEENGDPERAAFIRFECDFPMPGASHPRFREWLERSNRFDSLAEKWGSELPRLKGVKWHTYTERGFPYWVVFRSSKAFLDHADAVFVAAPVDFLDVCQLTNNTITHVLTSPYLPRLKHLILRGNYESEGVRKIASRGTLPRLESLCIWGGGCTNAAAEVLASADRFPVLHTLSFSNHSLDDRGVLAIAEANSLRSVKRLVLHGTDRLSAQVVSQLNARFESVE